MSSKEHTADFLFKKETKGTVVFEEVKDDDGNVVVGTIYVKKHFLKKDEKGEWPKKVSVSVSFEK